MPWNGKGARSCGNYTGLLIALLSVFSRYRHFDLVDRALGRRRPGAAFVVWLTLLLFIDLILLGVMIQQQIPAETMVAIALANPGCRCSAPAPCCCSIPSW